MTPEHTITTITEREAVKREREAAAYGFTCASLRQHVGRDGLNAAAEAFAREHYPLPKVERPRVVTDAENPTIQWRINEYGFQWGPIGCHEFSWMSRGGAFPTEKNVRVWADLLARPTELVDEP